jgi:hypothetical protein
VWRPQKLDLHKNPGGGASRRNDNMILHSAIICLSTPAYPLYIPCNHYIPFITLMRRGYGFDTISLENRNRHQCKIYENEEENYLC